MKVEEAESSGFSEGDELLDRAAAGLRDMPAPPGPSIAVMQRTREALNRRMREDAQICRPFILRPALLSLAAVVAILCASVVVYRMAFHHPSGRIASTDVKLPPGPASPLPPPPNPSTPLIEPPTPAPLVKATNPPAATPVEFAAGVITGHVLFDGVPPSPVPLSGVNLMPECQKAHGGPIYDESLVVNPDGTLANVVVSISSGLSGWLREEFPPPAATAVLNQKGCVFEPHVVAVMVGEPLLIKNSDPFLHNVHLMAVNNPEANLGQPTMGEMSIEPFESPEVFRVRCDVHPWMSAWVRVLDNPYFAVTGRDGSFTLRGLPPGTYTLKAWHEQLGVKEVVVTIGPDHGAGVDFTFKPMQ